MKLAKMRFQQVGMCDFSYCQHNKPFMFCHFLQSLQNKLREIPSLEEHILLLYLFVYTSDA